MDASELPAYLEGIAARVPGAALPAAMEMAQAYKEVVQRNLALSAHAPFTRTPSPPGFFPSFRTGNLQRHILLSGAGGAGSRAYASVSSDTIYSAVQEFGHVMYAKSWHRPMTWYMDNQWWSKYEVKVPARPYMRPTTINMIANGSLSRAASDAFVTVVWP